MDEREPPATGDDPGDQHIRDRKRAFAKAVIDRSKKDEHSNIIEGSPRFKMPCGLNFIAWMETRDYGGDDDEELVNHSCILHLVADTRGLREGPTVLAAFNHGFGDGSHKKGSALFSVAATATEFENPNDELVDRINALFDSVRALKLCACREFFCIDGMDTCFSCFAAAVSSVSRDTCLVCHEEAVQRTKCCRQPLHATCAGEVRKRNRDCVSTKCPGCREIAFDAV